MKFLCPFCKQKLEADKDLYGETVGCPSCENKILIPRFDLLKIEAKCPFCDLKFFIEENVTHSGLWDITDAYVNYEAPPKNELPILEEIENIDNSFFTNHEVCFTGFEDDEKKELKEMAVALGMIPRSGVTKNLTMLVCGRNAGPIKMSKAKEKGILILTLEEFKSKLS